MTDRPVDPVRRHSIRVLIGARAVQGAGGSVFPLSVWIGAVAAFNAAGLALFVTPRRGIRSLVPVAG